MTFRACLMFAPGVFGVRRARALPALLLLFLGTFSAAHAEPFVWDSGDDGIDDRVESVHLLGYHVAFENGDTLLRPRIEVTRLAGGVLLYSVYVVFDHPPTSADLLLVTGAGMPVLQRYRHVPAIRSVATYAQIQSLATASGVERVEAVPVIYPMDRAGGAAIAVRDPAARVHPTAELLGAPAGEGIVVAIIDSGVNDAASGSYPGHEALLGAFVGGAQFFGGDSSLDTPRDGSLNPVDGGGITTHSHGTHVASTILGRPGATGYATGVAPAARFADIKTVNDAGLSTSVPEAIDWCIDNRARDWGVPGYDGIDVFNLSVCSLDYSDGNDVAARLARRAAELGIVVVGAMGNDGDASFVPSPAAGDGVLAVGALDDQRTPLTQDDLYASFSNAGPRVSDGDVDPADEQKPDLIAPGVGVLAADGDLGTDGRQYRRMSGTSMSTAYVSGIVSILRSAQPSYSPAQITELLRSTAQRTISGPAGPAGTDPRWAAATGWGMADLHAAWIELQQPARTQVRRLTLTSTPTTLTGLLWTQRELGTTHLAIERALEQSGGPGAFAAYDSVAASGDGSLLDDNLEAYSRTWPVPVPERGLPFWYRVAYTEGGLRWVTPATRYVQPVGVSAATLEITIVHNAIDEDVNGAVDVGVAHFPLPASSSSVASDWVSGTSLTGNIEWTFRIEVPQGTADSYLPPNAANAWWLSLDEAGFLNRSGRLNDYRLIWHSLGGDLVFDGGPTPQQTVEGLTLHASVPQGLVAVEPPGSQRLSIGPNPIAAGGTVVFALRATTAEDLRVFDVTGREVGRVPFVAGAEGVRAEWPARHADGTPLASGLYFARTGSRAMSRVVVIAR